MKVMKTKYSVSALFAALAVATVGASFAYAADVPVTSHVMESAGTAKWGPAPPMLPPGAHISVLAGDPTKAGPYTIRLLFPPNYDIPAHSHPGDENVAVVSGELFMGMGNTLDKKAGIGLGVGGFALMPANVNHFAFTKTETTILLYGVGPVDFIYVNPADDPRMKTSQRAEHVETGPVIRDAGQEM